MPLSQFHPIVARWFRETLGEPTRAQQQAWAAIRDRRHTLVAAPTGSGKTLAGFLTALDDLFQEGLRAPLPDEVRVVYVSPLKALSADIHKNLAEPRRGIRQLAEAEGLDAPKITAATRTGDTTSSDRAAMLRTPPHILVTTPESLYLLLTAERSREMLRTVRTVIVDEIHAVIGTRRGAHLALSLERLQQVAEAPLVRLGLSATQKPIDEVARFLVGTAAVDAGAVDAGAVDAGAVDAGAAATGADGRASCAIVDEGHRRAMDLGIETPRSSLDAVMSHEVWEEYYERLATLIEAHKTTLVFVNTRKMAERLARHLSDRLGEEAVTTHHGSLSKEKRLDAEARLKSGSLRALVATASLELGIDIGAVDLVCQIGSPHRIATFLQRVGRSGHRLDATPKGRLFPVSRDDLIECAALLRAVRRGELDCIVSQEAPLDVLAQQVVAECASRDYDEEELFALVRRAWPYRDLTRAAFDAVIAMLADGFATRRGRRAALVHRDEVNARVRGRRGARMQAIASGGAIPEVADYRVLLQPEDTFIGTLNEDFAIESNAGDIFQLGNSSWQIQQVTPGIVRVSDAKGAPPSIPFWLGEAPARSDELSRAVSDLRGDLAEVIDRQRERDLARPQERGPAQPREHDRARRDALIGAAQTSVIPLADACHPAAAWLVGETGLSPDAAEEAVEYLGGGLRALGVMPTQETLVLERFFDESGGMQLVLHAPFGSRINKAWGLALRKRFCRQFNFELQAAATEDALMLSLGPQHSFPLSDVFRYLHPATARDVLVQAFLDAPVFKTRWRWNTTIALAVPRNRNGRKVPPQLQRMQADDLMAAVFPDAAACLENIPGDRQIPDHPLVNQTVQDCLQEAMDFDGLAAVLGRIHRGELRLVSCDTPEPSPLCHEILNARPYQFLDDAPLEERRAHAVYSRRAGEPSGADDLGALDADAIDRVREEARPDPRDADELHDALLTVGLLRESEVSAGAAWSEVAGAGREAAAARTARAWFEALAARGRATRVRLAGSGSPSPNAGSSASGSGSLSSGSSTLSSGSSTLSSGAGAAALALSEAWVAAERLPELLAVHPEASYEPRVTPPASRAGRAWARAEAIVELLRGRLTIAGPATAAGLAQTLGVSEEDTQAALVALESEGVVLRGAFTPRTSRTRELEWCERSLLARIHRYTLHRLRAEIEPVSPADFMRFLFAWQHVDAPSRLTGVEGLRTIIAGLDGFELPASAWERAVLPARLDRYDPALLDMLCLTGEIGWARLSTPSLPGGTDQTPAAAAAADTAADAAAARATAGRPSRRGDAAAEDAAPAVAAAAAAEDGAEETGDAGDVGEDGGDDAAGDDPAGVPVSAIARLVGGTPIALFLREHGDAWQTLRFDDDRDPGACERMLTASARLVLDLLRTRGASFSRELVAATRLDDATLRRAIGELVAAGFVASDGFAGLRAMIRGAAPLPSATRQPRADFAGRWSVLHGDSSDSSDSGAAPPIDDPTRSRTRAIRAAEPRARAGRAAPAPAPAPALNEPVDGDRSVTRPQPQPQPQSAAAAREAAVEAQAWALLVRYGVVFRRLLTREANAAPWRALTRVYRRLEARGEIRGGRFVSGMSGEQFALPDAVERMREIRRTEAQGRLVVISGADPLNLAGIITAGDRVRAIGGTRIAYRDGVPLAALEGDYVRPLADIPPALAGEVATALAGRRVPPVVRGYIGRAG